MPWQDILSTAQYQNLHKVPSWPVQHSIANTRQAIVPNHTRHDETHEHPVRVAPIQGQSLTKTADKKVYSIQCSPQH